jgi:hypothetical protein
LHNFLNALAGFLADQNLILGGVFLDALGGIDRVTDGGIFQALFRPNPTQNRFVINSYFCFRENIRRNAARNAVIRWRKAVRNAWRRIIPTARRAIIKLLCLWL